MCVAIDGGRQRLPSEPMDQQLASTLYTASTWVLPVLLAITLHEASHGFVAHLRGDDTAWRLGRVTFNPLKHVDPFGTILLPGLLLFLHAPFLFGYAKPVPVNFRALKNPRRDMVLVAAAGPGINIALALAAGLLAHVVAFLPAGAQQWTVLNLENAIVINVVLAVFNMIPLPPSSGGSGIMLNTASTTLMTMAFSRLSTVHCCAAAGRKPTRWASSPAAIAMAMLMLGPAAATSTMSRRGFFSARKLTGTGLA